MKTLKRGPELYALIKTLLSRLFFLILFFPRRGCSSVLPFLRPSIAVPRPEAFFFTTKSDRTSDLYIGEGRTKPHPLRV